VLERRLTLHPQVALRPEPFGALAYHYGTRRLVFLKHPDIVGVLDALAATPDDDQSDLAATLRACGIDERRWPSFAQALHTLETSGILHDRSRHLTPAG
jgi:putative mycofactocin binding protein MftB